MRLRWAVTAASVVVVTAATPAFGDCVSSAESAQSLRRDKKLVSARAELVACAADACPKFIRVDCLRWLDEVDAALPSIVVRANDAAGNDILDGSVSVDGVAVDSAGGAVSLDPGPHLVSVKRGAVTKEQSIMVIEGEKRRIVPIRMVESGASSAPPPPPSAASSSPGAWPWVFGAIGVAGLLTFGGLQTAAYVQYQDLKGSCAPGCDPARVAPIRTEVTASVVGLAVGMTGIVVAAALWLFWPRAPASRAAWLSPAGVAFRF